MKCDLFQLLDSQIILLDAHRSTTLRIEFCATQCARFCTTLSIHASGGGGPAVKYRVSFTEWPHLFYAVILRIVFITFVISTFTYFIFTDAYSGHGRYSSGNGKG